MPTKGRTLDRNRKSARTQSPSLVTEAEQTPNQETHASKIVRQAQQAPEMLTPGNVIRLQRTLGNRTSGLVLAGKDQRQPRPALLKPTMQGRTRKPGSDPTAKSVMQRSPAPRMSRTQATIQRAPLDFEATKRNYQSAYTYFTQVVEPWLDEVEKKHPEAAGTVEDVRTDVDYGGIDVTNWEQIEMMILMVNAKIGEENPHFRGETEEVVDYGAGWREERARLTPLEGGAQGRALEDLQTLIEECTGNVHSDNTHSVVGGIATQANKKVPGLNDASSRIDVQKPIRPGVYNLQYQVGNASLANVVFVGEDPKEVVLEKLVESFNVVMRLVSPRV